jgi:sulfofructose kinase
VTTDFAPIDALAIGVNVVDVLVRLPDHFTPGEKQPARDLVVQGGGPAATAACVLAALGWRTGFVTRLSDDPLSLITRAEFKRYGVVDDFFITDPDASPIAAVVHVDPLNGERTIFYMAERYHFLKAADIPLDVVRRAKLVLVDGHERDAAPTVLEAVREAGGRSVLDVEAGEPEAASRLLELASDCILPLSQARALTGEKNPERALRRLAKKTTAQLIVTDGQYGSWALAGSAILHQPAFSVVTVDTTGCGDAFHGAYGARGPGRTAVSVSDGTGRLGRSAGCARARWTEPLAYSRFTQAHGFVGLLVRTPSWFIEAAMGFGALANLETGSHVLAANWLALRFVKLQIFICDRHEQ